MSSYNLSELFELVVDAVPDRVAFIGHDRRLTFRELEDRANRLAHHLASVGVKAGDHVGLQLLNGSEYLEGMLAAYKLRAVPVNVNYRYVERELSYLFDNADLVALVFHRQFGPRVDAAARGCERLRRFLVVDDGSGEGIPAAAEPYEGALARQSAVRDFAGRTSDDLYVAYTGGTTGMPKGVLWRHEDIFFASMGGGDPSRMQGAITAPEQLTERIMPMSIVQLITPAFMHVSGHWVAFQTLYAGGTVVIPRPGSFDPEAVLRLASETRAQVLVLVGDAMVRPLLDTLEKQPGTFDLSSVMVLASGGAIFSPAAKDRARELLPNVMIVDGFGSTETGVAGSQMHMGSEGQPGGVRFRLDDRCSVLDEILDPVPPGSGRIGRFARCGRLPIGYYKDPAKTAATFVEKNGVRWVLPGDLASVEADGTIVIHGRGSMTINSGGEKIFPEEVEICLLANPAVQDAIVVGVPDERWGQRVVAVVQLRANDPAVVEALAQQCRRELAGYKVPREFVVVDKVHRNPNGKPDYVWARERAEQARN